MKEKITLCNQKENGVLNIVSSKFLTVELNENDMELYAKLEDKTYKVQGNVYCQFIVIEKVA